MVLTHDIGINIKREAITPDVYDWLEEQGMEYNKDWRFERGTPSRDLAEFDYVFKFVSSEHAVLFALRWA